MARSGCTTEGVDEEQNCIEFYTNFLDSISLDIRKDVISLIHELSKPGADTENARERCDDLIKLVDRELGLENIVSELVTKEMAECLRKMGLVDEAVDFISSRMERHKMEDFGSLLTLAHIHEISGNYLKAAKPRTQLLRIAETSGNPVLISLALVKMACNLWHLDHADKAKEHIRLCLDKLDTSGTGQDYSGYPFTENTHRLIDTYKTLGYIHRYLGDRCKGAEFYAKALEIVKQDEDALVHHYKLETQVACEYANSQFSKGKAESFCRSAAVKIKAVEANEVFMTHHALTVIHALSRVAHTLNLALGEHSYVLEIREELYDIAVKYLSQSHPEIARTAADTAFLCNRMEKHEKQELYIQRAESALEFCSDEHDALKLYVRELSDAWKSLALTYSNKKDFDQTKKCLDKALEVNSRVYGLSHPRLARLYKTIGCLYRKSNKFSEAVHYFRKCQEINDEFSPNDTKLRRSLKAEIGKTKALEKKYLNGSFYY